MTQITIATNSTRKQVLVNAETTLAQIIADNNIDTTGATIMLKGNVVSSFDLDRKLSDCGVADGETAILNVTVKAAAAAMTTKLENNVLTVVTDVKKSDVEAGISDLKVRDEDGNELFAVALDKSGNASVAKNYFVGNTYADGKLAATIILPVADASKDKVMKQYGEALLAAQKYTEQVAKEAAEKTAAIKSLFTEQN